MVRWLKLNYARIRDGMRKSAFETKVMRDYLAGQHESALHRYLEASEQWPRDPNVWMGIGDCHLELGELGAARSAYENMALYDDFNWRPQTKLAELLTAEGKFDEAASSFRQILSTLDSNTAMHSKQWVLSSFGIALLKDGNVAEAIDVFEQAISAGHKFAYLYEKFVCALIEARELEAAERFCLMGLSRVWCQTDLRCRLANIYSLTKRYEEAITLLRPLRPWYSRSTKRYHAEQLLLALSRLREYEDIVEFARKAILRRVRSDYLYSTLGWAHLALGDIQATIDAHELAVLEGTKDLVVHTELIILYVEQGQFAAARMACDRLRTIRERAATTMLEYIESKE